MPSLQNVVDKTTVNYDDYFYYTISASFNGVEGSIDNAKIISFIPDYIEITLPNAQEPIQKIELIEVTGGSQLVIDFGQITQLGVSATISFSCKFEYQAISGTSFENLSQLYINDELSVEAFSQAVELNAVAMYQLKYEKVLPTSANPTAGQAVYLKFYLENLGDTASGDTNIKITAPLPEGVLYDTTFTILGKDVSGSRYSDVTADDIQGNVQNNILTFTLPSYRGTEYEILTKVLLDESLAIDTQLTLEGNLSVNEIEKEQSICDIIIADEIYSLNTGNYGADYTLPKQNINYEFYIENTGNSMLENATITNELPEEVQFTKLSTGTFVIDALDLEIAEEYTIEYQTNLGNTGTVGTFVTNVNSNIDASEIQLLQDEEIIKLTWKFKSIGIGMKQRTPPKIDGIVRESTVLNTSIVNAVQSEWDTSSERDSVLASKTTLVQNTSTLFPRFKLISAPNTVYPQSIIKYRAIVDCSSSRLENPIIAFLLPSQLEFVSTDNVSYSNYFEHSSAPITPTATMIENFANTDNTLVKWQYSGEHAYEFWQRDRIIIDFTAKIPVGATGDATLAMLLGNYDNTGIVQSNRTLYEDNDFIAQNGVSNAIYASTAPISRTIELIAIMRSDNKVLGSLDEEYHEYPTVGKTFASGNVYYRLSLTNTGNITLENIELVDILPYTNDTGVIQIAEQRNSEFKVYSKGGVTAKVFPDMGITPQIDIMYSKSYNPIRFGNLSQQIGVDDDWSKEIPQDSTEIASFKISLKDFDLLAGQTLQIDFIGLAPVATAQNAVAWNSFSARADYVNSRDVYTEMLPVEAEKVGISIDLPQNPAQIYGTIWSDDARTGIYTDDSQGLNDMLVALYNEYGKIIDATITAQDANGNNGVFSFSNLEYGNYYTRLILDESIYNHTLQVYGDNASDFNERSGVSNRITLDEDMPEVQILGGVFILTTTDKIESILKFNKSANKMIRNVIYNQMLLSNKLEDTSKLIID